MKIPMKKRVLFLCTGNSARSQIAEAPLKKQGGEYFDVFSAGTSPEGIDPRTIAMRRAPSDCVTLFFFSIIKYA